MRVLLGGLCGAMVLSAAPGALIRPVMPSQLAFEPAEGGGGFVARANGYRMAISADGVYVGAGSSVVQIQFLRGRKTTLEGVERLPGTVNYLVGNDPGHWRRGVPTYAQVRGRGLYPGVDIVFHGWEGRLEYDLIAGAGAAVSDIGMKFVGAGKVSIDEQGDLIAGELRVRRPRIYQERDGRREIIAGHYVLTGQGEAAFAISRYDHGRALVIDPELVYAQQLGGKFWQATGVAADSQGNTYLATSNLGGIRPAKVLVTKLDPTGRTLYSTFVGGSSGERSAGIAVDSSGNAYVTGVTYSSDFPITPGALKIGVGSFIFKLNPGGDSLVYSALVTDGMSAPGGIAVDSEGSTYITGGTLGDLPVTEGAYWTTAPVQSPVQNIGPPLPQPIGIFILKLNPPGTHLSYATYANEFVSSFGLEPSVISSIAVDSSGDAYITPTGRVLKFNATGSGLLYAVPADPWGLGYLANAITLDAHGNAYITGSTNYGNAYVSKLNSNGISYFNTGNRTLAGGGGDAGQGIALDASGNIFIVGTSASGNFPLRAPVQEAFNPQTGFLAELDNSGNLLFSTYVGDTDSFQVTGLAVDAEGKPVFCGNTLTAAYVAKYDTSGIPALRLDSLANLASEMEVPVSPGELIAIKGAGFGLDTQLYFDNLRGTMLPRTSESDPFMAIVPYALSGKSVTLARVESGGQSSNAVQVQVVPAWPGIFTVNGAGTGQALAYNQDGTANSQAHPARAGSVITFYATGAGQTVPPGVDGVLHRSSPGLTVLPFFVSVLNSATGYQFGVGPAPGFPADVLKMGALIPSGVGSLQSTNLYMSENGVYAQGTVTVWVAP